MIFASNSLSILAILSTLSVHVLASSFVQKTTTFAAYAQDDDSDFDPLKKNAVLTSDLIEDVKLTYKFSGSADAVSLSFTPSSEAYKLPDMISNITVFATYADENPFTGKRIGYFTQNVASRNYNLLPEEFTPDVGAGKYKTRGNSAIAKFTGVKNSYYMNHHGEKIRTSWRYLSSDANTNVRFWIFVNGYIRETDKYTTQYQYSPVVYLRKQSNTVTLMDKLTIQSAHILGGDAAYASNTEFSQYINGLSTLGPISPMIPVFETTLESVKTTRYTPRKKKVFARPIVEERRGSGSSSLDRLAEIAHLRLTDMELDTALEENAIEEVSEEIDELKNIAEAVKGINELENEEVEDPDATIMDVNASMEVVQEDPEATVDDPNATIEDPNDVMDDSNVDTRNMLDGIVSTEDEPSRAVSPATSSAAEVLSNRFNLQENNDVDMEPTNNVQGSPKNYETDGRFVNYTAKSVVKAKTSSRKTVVMNPFSSGVSKHPGFVPIKPKTSGSRRSSASSGSSTKEPIRRRRASSVDDEKLFAKLKKNLLYYAKKVDQEKNNQ